MNEIKIFENEQFGQIRTIEINGEPHFVASDVAKALGYVRPNDAVSAHCRYTVKRRIPHPQSKTKTLEANCIPIGDVFRLGTHSELPGAEQFESWVYDEVLPTLHKTGKYEMPKKGPAPRQEKLASVNMAAKTLTKTLEAAGVPATFIALTVTNLYRDKAGININVPILADQDTPKLYDCTEIAKELGIYSKSGLPHKQAVATVIGFLDLSEEDMVKTPFEKNGHSGIATQYKPCVVESVKSWLMNRNYPKTIFDDIGKCYSIEYERSE